MVNGTRVPAQNVAKEIGGIFPLVEGAVGEVPKRSLAVSGLVDGVGFRTIQRDIDDKSVVGTHPGQLAGQDFTVPQHLLDCGVGGQAAISGAGNWRLPGLEYGVPVGPWAYMAVRVDGLPAQETGGSPRRTDPQGFFSQ